MGVRTGITLTALLIASAAAAQNAPPTYQADPDVYKLIFEDQNFRVIAATWKKGTTDKQAIRFFFFFFFFFWLLTWYGWSC